MILYNFLYSLLIFTQMEPQPVFDFNKKSNVQQWFIVDDVVMGGQSSGSFGLSNDGHGLFEGVVSLENNGGFSSVRYNFTKIPVEGHSKITIRLKGDGKNYQLRIKSNKGDYYSYIKPFSTSGDWETMSIPLNEFYPSFRGRKLDRPNFSSDHFEEIAILIGNKKPEQFKLLIDNIILE